MKRPLTSTPSAAWRRLPASSASADALDRAYFFTGKQCRNAHIAPSKVHGGCIICIGLAKARAEVRLHERIALRELQHKGPVERSTPLRAGTAQGRVLAAVSEHGGVFAQAGLVDPSRRGMSNAAVSRAFRNLLERGLIKFDGRLYTLTHFGREVLGDLGAS